MDDGFSVDLQVAHVRNFIFFRFNMGLVDNILAKCQFVCF